MRSFGSIPVCNHCSTKLFKSAYKEGEITRLHQQIRFLHQFLHLLTLSGRFRVGFGVGHMSNTIEHKTFNPVF